MTEERDENLLTLTADIVAAHVGNNSVSVADLAGLISNVHAALSTLGRSSAAPEPELKPAVGVRASIKPDFIVCLEDGKKMKMLKRHLMTDHGLTPADYRVKWSLPPDYPMVAPNYSDSRRILAKSIGLGRKGKTAPPAAKPAAAAVKPAPKRAPAKRTPRKKASPPAA